MRALVLQHHPDEHPGVFRDFLAADGVAWDAVELDAGEAIPDLSPYDLMIVMGGPQDVWQEDAHPWLAAEKAAIRRWAGEMGRPYLGFCLGHQLLAEALGGAVGPAGTPEIGVLDVVKTAEPDPVFAALPSRFPVLHWHGAEVTAVPPGARVLARSPACAVQAFAVGDLAYGLQFHLEATPETVPEWGAIPEYEAAMEAALGPGSLAQVKAEADAAMPSFNAGARALYDAFMARLRARIAA